MSVSCGRACRLQNSSFKPIDFPQGTGHFGHNFPPTRHFGTHRDNSAPQYWCRSLSRTTGGAVSHRNCPGSKCPGFSSITALMSKCLVLRFWCRSVLRSVPKCPRVSWYRSVLWPKCPVTFPQFRPNKYRNCRRHTCVEPLVVPGAGTLYMADASGSWMFSKPLSRW